MNDWVLRLRRFQLYRWWKVKHLVCDVLEAMLASEPEPISNDLGNALGALQDAVERRR
jgi:hypothetical protein